MYFNWKERLKMLKKSVLFLAALAFSVSAAYAAPEVVGRNDLTVDGSAFVYSDGGDNYAAVTGRLVHNVTENVGVGVESGYYFGQEILDDTSTDYGDLTGVPLMADVVVRYANPSKFVPYGVLGLGAIFWNFDESSVVTDAGLTAKVDDSFAVKLAGGADWYLNEDWALNFETGYVFANSDVTVAGGGAVASATADVDHWLIGGGVKRLF
ncbi:MAG: hypothetical protein HYT89_06600 [Candidatus Omnitrophica bacterium]|nr:hypothetical protein [Candidatus Omnitrophota bacterium]